MMTSNTKPKAERIYPEGRWTELLAAIGNNEEIAKLIREAGYDPPPMGSIQGWRSRGSIPSRWVPLFMQWALENRVLHKPGSLLKEPF